jgi:putative ABC transport system permease protein
MNTSRLLADGARTLARHPLRTGFSMLGALVGVAALTLVVTLGRGVEERMLRTVRQLFNPSSLMLMSGSGLMPGGPRAPGDRLTLDDLAAVSAALPQIAVWDPVQVLDAAPVRHGDASATARVVGSSERWERAWGRGVSRGESLDAAEVARGARVALVGETVARALFGDADPLGEELLVNGVSFRVIGLLQPFGTDAHGMDRDAEVVIPISTAMRRLLNVDTLRGAKLVVSDPQRVEETAAEVRRVLRERHGLPEGRPDDFKLISPVEVNRLVGRMQQVLFLFLPLVAGVALLAGAAVTAALSLYAVGARTPELGLRRALGARPRDVAVQILLETTVTMAAGGLLGLLVGGGGALLLAHHLALDAGVPWAAALLGLGLSILTGVAAGALPARRAAALSPVEALR